jgi:hypothetical protein
MKKLLWLDDVRDPNDDDWLIFSPIERPFEVHWAKTYGDFVGWISVNGLPDGICFDHDLGDVPSIKAETEVEEWFSIQAGREYTGYDCAKWLVDYCIDNDLSLPEWNIQSANPIGAENIRSLLNNFQKTYK